MKPLGLVLYDGPSLLDGKPIVVVLTGFAKSRNLKTGAMLQTYIIRSDVHPVEAMLSGEDYSICGDCKHRGIGKKRTCYVYVGQGPSKVYYAYKRGRYTRLADLEGTGADFHSLMKGKVVRIGAYGDPAAVPTEVWRNLLRNSAGWTGYTHQWREKIASGLRPFVMASADSEQEALTARSTGWRTFRVAMPKDIPKMLGESICPASAEAGRKLTCVDCQACDGAETGKKGSIVIQAHGGLAVMSAIKQIGAF